MQLVPPAQTLPHAPQFELSVFVLTHALPHWVWPGAQLDTHAAFEHTCPLPHLMPQPPQFAASLVVSMQTPLQSCLPAGHRQLPPLQLVPPEQTLPHAPQLVPSDFTSTHALPHCVVLGGHVVTHEPEEQSCPFLQAKPQLPQLFTSEATSVQAPLHSAGFTPVVHAHAPPLHVWPAAQVVLHLPQFAVSLSRLTHAWLQFVRPAPHVA